MFFPVFLFGFTAFNGSDKSGYQSTSRIGSMTFKPTIKPVWPQLPKMVLLTIHLLAVFSIAQEPIAQYGSQSAWCLPTKIESSSVPAILWKKKVGVGRSQVVSSGDFLFVASATNRILENKAVELNETIQAINSRTGALIWKNEVSSQMLEGQENYSGTPAAPQATPLVVGRRLISIGFTGIMQCLDLETGKVQWRKDLVSEFEAKAVQFGFAASPVMNPKLIDRFFVMAAGPAGGMYCLRVQTGELIWKAACDSFSYATPVFADFGGIRQILIVSEDHLMGISQDDGKQLWSHPLAEKGLTNVPSPLVLDSERVLISGQGCKGVRCLKIGQQDSRWVIKELWYLPRVNFFYQNWLKLSDEFAIGCTDKFLAIIDTRAGSMVGRWRGFADSNLNTVEGGLIALTGNGSLKLLRTTSEAGRISGLENWAEFEVLKARCWTPLTEANGMLIIRGGTELIALSLSAGTEGSSKPLTNKLSAPEILKFTFK